MEPCAGKALQSLKGMSGKSCALGLSKESKGETDRDLTQGCEIQNLWSFAGSCQLEGAVLL